MKGETKTIVMVLLLVALLVSLAGTYTTTEIATRPVQVIEQSAPDKVFIDFAIGDGSAVTAGAVSKPANVEFAIV